PDPRPVEERAPQNLNPLLTGPMRVPEENAAKALRFVWRDHPSIRAGRALRLDFSAKIQEDARDPGDNPAEFPTLELHRPPVGVDGEVFRKIQFSIEREFSERLTSESSGKPKKSQWKDVYVEANIDTTFQFRVGKFKIPYGLDQTSSETNLDFVYRSGGGNYL